MRGLQGALSLPVRALLDTGGLAAEAVKASISSAAVLRASPQVMKCVLVISAFRFLGCCGASALMVFDMLSRGPLQAWSYAAEQQQDLRLHAA